MAEPIVIGEPTGGRNRRVLILAGVAVVVVLAAFVLPGLLFGGDDGSGDAIDDFALPPAAVTTTVPGEPPAETFQSFSDKNPFSPLVELGGSSGGEAPPAVPSTDTPTPTISDGGAFPFPDEGPPPTFPPDDQGFGESPTTTTTAAGPPPPPPRQPDRVSLLEVFTDQSGTVVASVRVNDVTHQVARGDEFATSYRVLDLDIGTRCGQFLFGDDRFGLCEGEETLK